MSKKEAKIEKSRNQSMRDIKQKASRLFSADNIEKHTIDHQNALCDKLSKERLQKLRDGDAVFHSFGS